MNDDAEATLQRVRFASRLLDEAVRIPGTRQRVGLDPVVGLLPVGGDVVGMALSLYTVAEAARLGVPRGLLARMLVNAGVDVAGGSIPVTGILVDALWRANARNVALLERHLEE